MSNSLKRTGEGNGVVKSKIRKVSAMPSSKILQMPVKSYSDKKEYRLMKLPNGLSALLVQHFIEEDPADDDNQDNRKVSESSVLSQSSDVQGSEESISGEDEEDEDDHKEKLAAVALCIQVGSFFDPPEIQGLSHFLEHMVS